MRINTKRLRIVVAVLGMALPWIVAALIGYFPDSISATYYTNAGTVFVIILGWASGLLVCYKGYELIDDIVFTLSGIFGFGICLFPCWIPGGSGKIGTFKVDVLASNTIHMICALCFFALIAYASFFLFTKSSGEMTKQKKIRNIIYRVCGVGMLAAYVIMLLPHFYGQPWLSEMFSLTFFGISFLTKANIIPWLACDTPGTEEDDHQTE
jgi:hypothetical protein